MLQRLLIQNYAIIDDLQVDFSDGLNIITGETGAGKSILMGALNLILGQRADSSVLRHSDKKCIVEGTFHVKDNEAVRKFFITNELDEENEVTIRREIAVSGKSRSFINDTPVNLSQVKALSLLLVDLHQQFDTLEINSEAFQREVLDVYAGNAELISRLSDEFEKYDTARKTLQVLEQQQEQAGKEFDYNQFLYRELEELGLKENELEQLESELKLLSNAENIKQQLSAVYFELKDSEHPLLQQLKALLNRMKGLEDFHSRLPELCERLSVSVIELQDIAGELEDIEQRLQTDAERIHFINERISAGYKLLKKHGVQETNQLLTIQSVLQQKLNTALNITASIKSLNAEKEKRYQVCKKTADKISANRKSALNGLADQVNKLLFQVGMPNARLKIELTPVELSASGTDSIVFLFDANKTNRFEPLSKVASGGELSRLMLSIKSLVAQQLALPTLIFDEIDTGISGEAARQVGLIMKELSKEHQLIAITHQPQIAARATAHYFVFKETKGKNIFTGVKKLSEKERIHAIAQMLGGEQPTAAALENAKEMVAG